jgi:hypothetical protein
MVNPEEPMLPGARNVARRGSPPVAVNARYDKRVHRIVIGLSCGIDISFPPRNAQGLETAKAADLDIIRISPSGLGLHFPKLDADLYLPAILEGTLGSSSWLAARLERVRENAASATEPPVPRMFGRPLGEGRAVCEPPGSVTR